MRLQKVWGDCKSKKVCEAGASLSDGQDKMSDSEDEGPRKGCGHLQPEFLTDGLRLIASFSRRGADDEGKIELTTERVYKILKNISDEDCIAMGLSPDWARPDWMLLTVLPVPPPPVRPSIMMDSTARGEDDLTYKLADIIKANTNLKKHEIEGAPGHILSEWEALLQVWIFCLCLDIVFSHAVSRCHIHGQ